MVNLNYFMIKILLLNLNIIYAKEEAALHQVFQNKTFSFKNSLARVDASVLVYYFKKIYSKTQDAATELTFMFMVWGVKG